MSREGKEISAAVLGQCAAYQDDEMMALEAIYGSDVFLKQVDGDRIKAKVTIIPQLPKEKVTVKIEGSSRTKLEPVSFQVHHLPPIYLELLFPDSYPELAMPRFLVTSHWLTPSDLGRLCKKMDEIWTENEGTMIVFLWVDFLEKESLHFLEMSDDVDLRRLVLFQGRMNGRKVRDKVWKPSNPGRQRGDNMFDNRARTMNLPPAKIGPFLLDYNLCRKKELFEAGSFECKICFSTVVGKDMTQFEACDHVFCNDCTRQQFITQITSGCPNGPITCMEHLCTTEALISDVKRLVGEEMSLKYDQLLLSRYLSTMADITTCPRKDCQKPVIVEGASKVATCAACTFSFCLVCKMAWHGVNPCRLLPDEAAKIVNAYLNGGPAEKSVLEKKYDRKYLNMLASEFMSREWISKNSKSCPTCKTDIEKAAGCNKMTCYKCQALFCYLCGTSLTKLINPYSHFNDPKSPCNRRLFEGDDPDEGNDDEIDLDWLEVGGLYEYGEFEDIDFEAM